MTQFQRTEGWVGSQVDDNFVMLHIDTGNYVALNSTAAAIWEALATPKSSEGVTESLLLEYDVDPSACATSVARALEQMSAMQLVTAA